MCMSVSWQLSTYYMACSILYFTMQVGWDVDISAPTSITQECQTLYCVSLPAENEWSEQVCINYSTYILKVVDSLTTLYYKRK